jgi:phosphatidylglycerol---prolipoprotein diacylglyceryl transferase
MLPELFRIGNFPVHSWGLLLMIGFLLAAWRAAKHAPRYNLRPEDVWDASLIGLFGGVVGARLAFVLLNLKYFSAHPTEVFAIWTGGMTFYGGLVGGLGAGLLAAKYLPAARQRAEAQQWAERAKAEEEGKPIPDAPAHFNLWDFADLAAVSFPIGYGIGRVGCFLNGCCYGAVCDLPWAVRFHLHDGTTTPPSHPAQLYSAVAALVMYVILLAVEKRRQFRGQLILAFGILYGVYRFLIEFVREGATADPSGIASLTQGQVASLVLSLLAGIAYYLLVRRQPKAAPVTQR